uniref:Uncharacterized protein n=1 Tax=Aegilops tauschii subsp. strangulata TaxID=200361 RepID=A0A453JK97_AEGTS
MPKLLWLPSQHPLHQSSSINGQCTHKLYGTIMIVIQHNSLLNFFALPCCFTAILWFGCIYEMVGCWMWIVSPRQE